MWSLLIPVPHGITGTWDEIALIGGAFLIAGVALWFLLGRADDEEEEASVETPEDRSGKA